MTYQSSAYTTNRIDVRLRNIASYSIFAALVVIYLWFGGMKFTHYEAQGLVPLVSSSPLLSWMYDMFSVRGFSTFLGVVEVSIALLIAGRVISPWISAAGGILSTGLFITTISFMLSTPGVFETSLGFPAISVMPGQFLLKDIGLLAASFFVFAQSLSDIAARQAAPAAI